MVGASSRSMWRLRMGIEQLLKIGYATGQQVSSIVGHFTHKSTMRRELLSILDHTYRFVEDFREQKVYIPAPVRAELWTCRSLIHFVVRDLSADWNPCVH
eukprot:4874307-Karenia_brevis.AAC.1